jgi:hypothetical protein
LISYAHPGDEYALYIFSNLIGAWLPLVLSSLVSIGDVRDSVVPTATAVGGGLLVFGWTAVLRRLSVPVVPFLALWLVLGGIVLFGFIRNFDSVAQALGKNGSWTAYLSASSNFGLTGALVLAPLLGLLRERALLSTPLDPS